MARTYAAAPGAAPGAVGSLKAIPVPCRRSQKDVSNILSEVKNDVNALGTHQVSRKNTPM